MRMEHCAVTRQLTQFIHLSTDIFSDCYLHCRISARSKVSTRLGCTLDQDRCLNNHCTEFYYCPLLALIVVAEAVKPYTSPEYKLHIPAMQAGDAFALELSAERKAALKITKMLKQGLNVADAKAELLRGQWWERGKECSLHFLSQ